MNLFVLQFIIFFLILNLLLEETKCTTTTFFLTVYPIIYFSDPVSYTHNGVIKTPYGIRLYCKVKQKERFIGGKNKVHMIDGNQGALKFNLPAQCKKDEKVFFYISKRIDDANGSSSSQGNSSNSQYSYGKKFRKWLHGNFVVPDIPNVAIVLNYYRIKSGQHGVYVTYFNEKIREYLYYNSATKKYLSYDEEVRESFFYDEKKNELTPTDEEPTHFILAFENDPEPPTPPTEGTEPEDGNNNETTSPSEDDDN
ncbi:hypothetical protein Mgra_00005193 [Meloidogyne graminicola]|uniref:Uncharacterized protein n=1 Tax=Meloidogyne graminicola TaxID=189291 RepID=A0A8S9ZQ93_9BILA|nr:hypothetical protein Mgra_00005193 [Meloidogyne graminicola]